MGLDRGYPAAASRTRETLFSPVRLGGVGLGNRLVVAPMTRVSATDDGLATPRMAAHYRAFAEGGFGLVITEGIYTDRSYAQGYLDQPGLTDRAQTEAWRAVVDGVHAVGGKIVAQLMHAGALSQGNPHRDRAAGPSAVQPKGRQMEIYRGSGPYRTPVAMSDREIEEALSGFARAAGQALTAGFDGVEVHGANGYLLDQFLTDSTNRRTDRYGGETASRIGLTAAVARAVRKAVGPEYLVGVRISQAKVNDLEHKWAGGEADAQVIFAAVAEAGVDYIHTTAPEAGRAAFGDGGPSLAALAKRHGGVSVIANGSLDDPDRAAALLAKGDADLVALARGAVANPDWADRVQTGRALSIFDRSILQPLATLENAERWRARQDSNLRPTA